MNLFVIAFSRRGAALAERLLDALPTIGHHGVGFVKSRYPGESRLTPVLGPMANWTRSAFERADGLVFVGACGIAVREIAPFLRGKAVDPAIIVLDERANFCIALLSGHIGGANALANALAPLVDAIPIVTTASDLSGGFAVDEWATRQKMAIGDLQTAKAVSAALLDGVSVGFQSDFPVEGALPNGVWPCSDGPLGIAVSARTLSPFSTTLRLIPRVLTLGIGCRRGVSAQEIQTAVQTALDSQNLSLSAVREVRSIDLKAHEPGLLNFCSANRLVLRCLSAQALAETEGAFSHSNFVLQTVGVDNVCERAAASNGGGLLVHKTAIGPVTVAVAQDAYTVYF